MWKFGKKKSGEESGGAKTNPVYDFFYHDPRRVGSYLAQFDPNGLLQSVKQTIAIEESEGSSLSGGVAVAVAKGQYSGSEGSASKAAAEKTYDPFWLHTLTLLDFLRTQDLVASDIESAQIGRFVLCEGQLVVVDSTILQKLYATQEVRAISRGKAIDPASGKPVSNREFNLNMIALQEAPPNTQSIFATDNATIWCTLRPEGMITPPSEILLKHGTVIGGRWHLLGIKDADRMEEASEVMKQAEKFTLMFPASRFLGEMISTSAYLQAWLGRPASSFGITPLAIFRQIGG